MAFEDEKASLNRVSAKVGITTAGLYKHFKNKEDLLTAIQDYVTEQLLNCLKNAYEQSANVDSPEAIYNMGKAYVLFFIEFPEYYSFLFTQPCLKIDLSGNSEADDFEPFRYYREKAYSVYRSVGMSEDRIKYGVIAMWAKVHGLASIASMKGVSKDFEWDDVLANILVE